MVHIDDARQYLGYWGPDMGHKRQVRRHGYNKSATREQRKRKRYRSREIGWEQ